MKQIKTSLVIAELKSHGFRVSRQNGSHLTLTHASGSTITLVNTREQSQGVLRQIKSRFQIDFESEHKTRKQNVESVVSCSIIVLSDKLAQLADELGLTQNDLNPDTIAILESLA